MAKVIREYIAECLDVQPVNEEIALEWSDWRQCYIGLEGWLNLCVSERKYPGWQFLYFFGGDESDKDWYLKTSYGQPQMEDGLLVFRTNNSRYTFRLLHEAGQLPS